jgi:hypothetical protein
MPDLFKQFKETLIKNRCDFPRCRAGITLNLYAIEREAPLATPVILTGWSFQDMNAHRRFFRA